VKAFRSWLKTDFCKSAFNAKIAKQIAAKIVEKKYRLLNIYCFKNIKMG
jgi:hypothetical protein